MSIREDLIIDWEVSPRIILIDSDSSEITVQDLYDTIRSLAAQAKAMDDEEIVDAGGKEGGIVAVTMTLFNAKIKFKNTGIPRVCKISKGNLFAVDEYGSDMSPIAYNANVTVGYAQSTSPALVETGVSGLTAEESAQLMGLPLAEDTADAVWDEPKANHIGIGTVGKAIQDMALEETLSGVRTKSDQIKNIIEQIKNWVNTIYKIEVGGWKIVKNQYIVYAPDNKTEIARFNLFDKNGKPTEVNPSQMKRV